MSFLLLFALTGLSSTFASTFSFSSNLDSLSPDTFSHSGRGSQVVALGSSGTEASIRITTLEGGLGLGLSVPLAKFTPVNKFGGLEVAGDHHTGELLFISENNARDSSISIYHADWYGGDWTLRQSIVPPGNVSQEMANPSSFFGSKFAVDRKSHRSLAVGYGDASQFLTYSIGYGKICMYEATSSSAESWLSTQELIHPNVASNSVLRMGGAFLSMHGDVVLADTFTPTGMNMEIFHRGKSGLWTHQQTLAASSSTQDVVSAVVYDQTIVYSINYANGAGGDLIGKSSVHIMHPNTPEFSSSSSRRLDQDANPSDKPKPKPTTETKPKPKSKSKSKSKPRPDPLEWSVVQTLWSPNHNFVTVSSGSDVGFGQDLSLHENTLIVAEVGDGINSGFLYVFLRTSTIGMFSMQQTITPSIATNTYLSSHSLNNNILMASSLVTPTDPSNDLWVGNTEWGCLTVRLEDAFGDGWSGAKLVVDTPFKAKDHYAPLCYTNPLIFRYCPSNVTQEGRYRMHIIDTKDAMFVWEIQWSVQVESTGKLHRGDHKTEMDFLFKDGKFTSGKIDRELSTNMTCSGCNGVPKPKPKPKPKPTSSSKPSPKSSPEPEPSQGKGKGEGKPTSRRLHPKEHTVAPTMSPAPTLDVTAGVDSWSTLSMYTTGADWFRDEYTGTHFFISDVTGQHLHSAGTMCSGYLEDSCVQNLPDGEYTLRVTGDLSPFTDDQTWSFCSRIGLTSDSLTFEISNGVCTPLLRVTTSDACVVINPASGVLAYEVALGSFVMAGSMTGQLSSQDKMAFERAVEHTIPGAVTDGVSVLSLENDINNEGVVVKFSVQLDIKSLGYNPLEYESVASLFSYENNFLSTSRLSQKMIAELSGAVMLGGVNSYFTNVEAVHLVSFSIGEIEFSKSPLVTESSVGTEDDDTAVVSFAESEIAQNQAQQEKEMYEALGFTGYALAAASIVGLVVLAVVANKRRHHSVHDADVPVYSTAGSDVES